MDVSAGAETSVAITALTYDEPRDPDQDVEADTTLADFIGSEYMLRRIVGKCFASYLPATGTPLAALFGAGFFVARAADAQQGEDQPIGSQSLAERQSNYNPLADDCIREPWIWRRTWILGDAGIVNPLQGSVARFPQTTAHYGSAVDGPHIDAQTMRRVTGDERLFFVVAARAFPIAIPATEPAEVFGYLDYRLLGSLMKARARGVF